MEEISIKDYVMCPEKWEASRPLVSIIAICHKHTSYVVETLDSIRNQTYGNIELIIINNLKDACEGIIQNWIEQHNLNCRFIQNEVIRTVTQNCNIGLSMVNGKYYQVISCDDILINTKICSQVDVLEKFTDVSVVHGYSEQIDENGHYIKMDKLNINSGCSDLHHKIFVKGLIISAPSVLMRTKSVYDCGAYDENILVEDFQLFLKLSKNSKFYYPPNQSTIISTTRITEPLIISDRHVEPDKK